MNNNEERLNRIERIVDELQNKEIVQLRQDHVELKDMFLEIKNQQKNKLNRNQGEFETGPKPKARILPKSNDADHKIRIKRPFRLVSFPSMYNVILKTTKNQY